MLVPKSEVPFVAGMSSESRTGPQQICPFASSIGLEQVAGDWSLMWRLSLHPSSCDCVETSFWKK